MKNYGLMIIFLALFLSGLLINQSFYIIPNAYADFVVKDSTITGGFIYTRPTGTGDIVATLTASGNIVNVYSLATNGAITGSTTYSLDTIATTKPTQTATSVNMKCSGTICFVLTDGSSKDKLIGINISDGTIVGNFNSTGIFASKFLVVRSSTLVYVADGGNTAKLVSTPSGVCTGTSCTVTWFALGTYSSNLLEQTPNGGAVGTISGTPYLFYINSGSNSIRIYNIFNNGFVTHCTYGGGAFLDSVTFTNGHWWTTSHDSSFLTRAWDASKTGSTCDDADITADVSCSATNTLIQSSASSANNEVYVACKDNVNIVNSTDGTIINSVNLPITAATNYVTYNFHRDAIIALSSTNARVILQSGTSFTNNNEDNPRTNPDIAPILDTEGETVCIDINPNNTINSDVICYSDTNGDGVPDVRNTLDIYTNQQDITVGGQNLLCQIGIQTVCDNDDATTSGVGYLYWFVLFMIMAVISAEAFSGSYKDKTHVMVYVVVMVSSAFIAYAFGWIDFTLPIITIFIVAGFASVQLYSFIDSKRGHGGD